MSKHYWRRVLEKIRTILHKCKTINFGVVKYKLPRLKKNTICVDATHEEWFDNFYSFCLESREGTFVDVGANKGQTLAKILSISPDREYIGFEPQASCAYLLDEFIRENSLVKHQIIPVGLSDKTELCKIYMRRAGSNDSTASIVSGFRPMEFYKHSSYIAVMCGDEIFDAIGVDKICVLKVDVEGAELEVLKGLEKTIKKLRPYVAFEVLNNYLVVTKSHLDEETIIKRNERAFSIGAFLNMTNYRIFNVRNGDLVEVRKIEPIVSDDLSITDYVGIPEEYLSTLSQKFRGKIIWAPEIRP